MKGLEALKRIRQETCPATYMQDFDKEECCQTIEKELKAFAIIKHRNISIELLKRAMKRETLNWYNSLCLYPNDKLLQEEYDLLKEILNND